MDAFSPSSQLTINASERSLIIERLVPCHWFVRRMGCHRIHLHPRRLFVSLDGPTAGGSDGPGAGPSGCGFCAWSAGGYGFQPSSARVEVCHRPRESEGSEESGREDRTKASKAYNFNLSTLFLKLMKTTRNRRPSRSTRIANTLNKGAGRNPALFLIPTTTNPSSLSNYPPKANMTTVAPVLAGTRPQTTVPSDCLAPPPCTTSPRPRQMGSLPLRTNSVRSIGTSFGSQRGSTTQGPCGTSFSLTTS